jgi:CubicO group peptidase (beta-lactamase class C family)
MDGISMRRAPFWIACFYLVGCGGGGGGGNSGGSNAAPPTITSVADTPQLMAHYRVPGVSVALIKNASLDRLLVFGVRNQQSQEPVTETTQFQAGSISKAVAAVAALKFVQDRRIDLDANINETLVSWKVKENSFTASQPVTLRMLLNHTAGTTVHGFPGYRSTDALPSLQQILDGAAPSNTQPIVVDKLPGQSFRYSGGGYLVMQQALIDLNGASFAAIAKSVLFDPLAMNESTYAQPLPDAQRVHAAMPHGTGGGVLPEGAHIYPELAAAGLWTTPNDLAKLLIEIQRSLRGQSNLLISQQLATEMVTAMSGGYGLGFQIMTIGGDEYFAHGGVNAGFHLYMIAHKSKGVAAVIMTNSDNGSQLIDRLMPVIVSSEGWASP